MSSLEKNNLEKIKPKPVCLVIMDGLAYGSCSTPGGIGNAVMAADTPCLDELFAQWPHSWLKASGRAVGLPEGQMGNSEVGHLNIGAGRVVYQELTRIDLAIEDGSFFENDVLGEACASTVRLGSTLHIMGLVSDGGVHSSINHIDALLELAKRKGLMDVAIHCFLDGRDTPPQSGVGYIRQLEEMCQERGIGHIASIMGRYYAMDRDNRWDRIAKAYKVLTQPVATRISASEAVLAAYARGETDEFIEPIALTDSPISDSDSVIFFNFRPDRARELTAAFINHALEGFARPVAPSVNFVCMTQYDATFNAPVAFPKNDVPNVLADVISRAGLRQIHIAETEKYAHVTFFFNGGVETPKVGEERILIPSPKVATYDLHPEMSALAIGDALVDAICHNKADVYICNFANGDMVGHTGVFDAAITAVATVDSQVGRIVEVMQKVGGSVFITADHGNAEKMLDDDGKTPFTAHTCDDVPLLAVNTRAKQLNNGRLCDVAPTMLAQLAIEPPDEWTGINLMVY